MITVIKDNTKLLYYTKCRKCKSEFNYEYEDVDFKVGRYIQMAFAHITCPICNFQTIAELQTKDEYKGDVILPNLPTFTDSCCCDPKAGDGM